MSDPSDVAIGILIIAAFLAIFLVPLATILRRVGFSSVWAIFSLIPLVGIIVLWCIAFSKWPNEKIETPPSNGHGAVPFLTAVLVGIALLIGILLGQRGTEKQAAVPANVSASANSGTIPDVAPTLSKSFVRSKAVSSQTAKGSDADMDAFFGKKQPPQIETEAQKEKREAKDEADIMAMRGFDPSKQ